MYTYKRTEFSPYELYTVGSYDSGNWQPESDHDTEDQASKRVHFLNGGTDERLKERIKALEDMLGLAKVTLTLYHDGFPPREEHYSDIVFKMKGLLEH